MDKNLNSVKPSCTSVGRCYGEEGIISHESEGNGPEVALNKPATGSITDVEIAGLEMGNGPQNVKKSGSNNVIKCQICSCEMSSYLVLKAHINGSRHKKKMKALEIVEQLRAAGEKGIEFGLQDSQNAYGCEICSVTVNSPQQLEIHLAGTKHKNRLAKEKMLNAVNPMIISNSQDEELVMASAEVPPSKKRKKDGKSLSCDVCNVMMNSEIQYEQHIQSKRHSNKSRGESHKERGHQLENKPNFIAKNAPGKRHYAWSRWDKSSSRKESFNRNHSPNNMNRLSQVHSQKSSRSDAPLDRIKNDSSHGLLNTSFHRKPFLNSHNNFESSFGALWDNQSMLETNSPPVFNPHDSVAKARASNP